LKILLDLLNLEAKREDSCKGARITCGGVESVLVQFVLLCPRSALASLELLDHVWARQEGSYSGRCKRGTHGIVVYAFIVWNKQEQKSSYPIVTSIQSCLCIDFTADFTARLL